MKQHPFLSTKGKLNFSIHANRTTEKLGSLGYVLLFFFSEYCSLSRGQKPSKDEDQEGERKEKFLKKLKWRKIFAH